VFSFADLLEPVTVVADPSRRLFWGAIVSSLLLASLATARQRGEWNLRRQLSALFAREYWMTRETGEDLALLFFNNAMRALILLPILGGHLAMTLVVGGILQDHLGDAPDIVLPGLVIAGFYGLVFFLAEDLSRFLLHKSMHNLPVLWRFHRLHHDTTTLTPLTIYRVHPIESALYFGRALVVFGLVSGAFIWFFGRQLTTFDVLGVGVAGFLFNLAGANLRHSHVWLSFGPLERWFISPSQHQLHHSKRHGHANLGTCLAVWDRASGTWLGAGPPQALQFGIAGELTDEFNATSQIRSASHMISTSEGPS